MEVIYVVNLLPSYTYIVGSIILFICKQKKIALPAAEIKKYFLKKK